MQAYLIMCRNSRSDFAEFADLVQAMDIEAAATVLAGMDRYYSSEQCERQWVATQLVRRLADPDPSDVDDDRWAGPEGVAEWERVRQRCLSVAVAILEEAR
jgi:RND superfamily putative drug exporter